MIIIFSPLQREFVKELFHQNTYEDVYFEFVKQEGMKLFFNVTPNNESAIKIAKNTLKASKFGSSLNFMVEYKDHV